MNKEELFAAAKEEIFGAAPECPLARLGHSMAVTYYSAVIRDAEAFKLEIDIPRNNLATLIVCAFKYASEPIHDILPEESKRAIQACGERFRARYEPLLEQLKIRVV